MPDDVCVRDAAVGAQHRGVGGHRVAERAEQPLAGRVFSPPFRRADVAVAVANLLVLDEEAVDHAVAGEPVVVGVGLEVWIGPVTIEGAGEFGGDLADDLQVEIRLVGDGREVAGEKGIDAR